MSSIYHSKVIVGGLSPESLIIPPQEDVNTKQEQIISGERFPDNTLILCEKCHWRCTCFNMRGLVERCPLCGTSKEALSRIPLTLDEAYLIEYDDKRYYTYL